MKYYSLIIFWTLFFSVSLNAQVNLDSLFNKWEDKSVKDIDRSEALYQYISEYLKKDVDSAETLLETLNKFNALKKLEKQQNDYNVLKASFLWIKGRRSQSVDLYQKALNQYVINDDKKGQATSLLNLGRIYKTQWDIDNALDYYDKALNLAIEIDDKKLQCLILINKGNVYALIYKHDKALEYINQSLELSIASNDKSSEAYAYVNISHIYARIDRNEEALVFCKKGIALSKELNDVQLEHRSCIALSKIYENLKEYKNMYDSAYKGLNYAITINSDELARESCHFLYVALKKMNRPSEALFYLEEVERYHTLLEDNKALRKLENIEYSNTRAKDSLIQVQKDLKMQLAHQQEITKNETEKRQLTYSGILIFILILILAGLLYWFIKKKQYKAIKKINKEISKKEKQIKLGELATLNALIKGQETERQRVALELHDSVGSSLTAAKMQFEYLYNNRDSDKDLTEIYDKTQTVLKDAYNEVRAISHFKNNGVMARHGLIPAIEQLSKNASGVNGLTIDVNFSGQNESLDNQKEISIFRIIQELVTNIIKHAQATEAFVNVTQHEKSLVISITDNGKGFDTKKMSMIDKGIGLDSVESRVVNMKGHLELNSTIGKGTSILIDIPA